MKLLIDGAAFQLAALDSMRIWQSLLPALSAQNDIEVMVLDRGGLSSLVGAKRIPFPSYKNRYTADDSALIQQVCDFYDIDVFTSTHHTTPLATPTILVVHDTAPEHSDMDRNDRRRQERAVAFAHARRHIVMSAGTRDVLRNIYPALDRIAIVRPGVDHAVFKPANTNLVAAFRQRTGLNTRPYLVTYDRHSDDNAALVLDTVARFGINAFDILCIGNRGANDRRLAEGLPAAVKIERIDAASKDIAVALSGAAALIHPADHDGSDLTLLEAMACGCPVVTTSDDTSSDVTGDACLILKSASPAGLAVALTQLRLDTVRADLRRMGLKRASGFDWSALTTTVVAAAREAAALRHDAAYQAFAQRWKSLRLVQAEVDSDTWAPSV